MTLSPQIPAAAVVFDLEFTAWEGTMTNRWMRPGEYQEVVQIGAVKVDAGFAVLETFDTLVRPRLNPELSDFLIQLTGITNEELRVRGVDFAEAYRSFLSFVGDLPIVAYGRDELVLAANLRLYGITTAPIPPYINVTPWLVEQGIDMRGLHSCDVGPMAGVPFSGHKHNGLDDALSVAAGVQALISRGVSSPLSI